MMTAGRDILQVQKESGERLALDVALAIFPVKKDLIVNPANSFIQFILINYRYIRKENL